MSGWKLRVYRSGEKCSTKSVNSGGPGQQSATVSPWGWHREPRARTPLLPGHTGHQDSLLLNDLLVTDPRDFQPLPYALWDLIHWFDEHFIFQKNVKYQPAFPRISICSSALHSFDYLQNLSSFPPPLWCCNKGPCSEYNYFFLEEVSTHVQKWKGKQSSRRVSN